MSIVTEGKEAYLVAVIAKAVLTATDQAGIDARGYTGSPLIEAVAVGTVSAQAVTFKVQGSLDNVHFYDVGYEEIDATASPARAVAGIALTPGNGTVRKVYEVLDVYPYYRASISANTLSGTGAGLTVTLYDLPV